MAIDLPAHLKAVLPPPTREVWQALVGNLPDGAYLVGGTGIAAHLGHRVSRDLDFFVGKPFEPQELAAALDKIDRFAATQVAAGTLNGYLGETRVQFLDARDQHPVDAYVEVAGIPVAGLRDLLATKLKVVGDRGELRDYFDLLVLERDAGHRVEEGLAIVIERYRPATPEAVVLHIVRALGSMEDVADDPALPMNRSETEAYWARRQPEIVRSLDWLTGRQTKRHQGPGPDLSG
ncbi:MAG: nucleotidyl transferase AbiEii/AbiGii toxin family protein [Acidimicrobiia bacterium]|nr:nucleotidyl transferase AbiEii/AbiGii toxin family protein [Acidimicrobiia bacterium]MDH3469696.1 nucleotidyl transferase AbiEii/AbiGii toxin family protein [Acidimicrobiia bacterium]